MSKEETDEVGHMFQSMVERDPKKRRVKPVGPAHQQFLDFDLLEESSDDSDFRIEDHCEESDDDSIDSDDNSEDKDDSGDSENDDVAEEKKGNGGVSGSEKLTVEDVIQQARERQASLKQEFDAKEASRILICCGCLGDRSDDTNEIVECDGCGVTVHEGCYGVSDTASVSSTVSSCSTEPWFCEACRAGVIDPSCELCPNLGGIFKETDVGRWVHLVCALYIPGVAFGEVDKLSSVTLFEMPYNKWGTKVCALCEDERFCRTGVCINCDAGMCKTYFHVTCAQREGLLSEAHSEEVDQADPFYAHCKMHSDKALVRRRRRNWLALQLRMRARREHLQGARGAAEQARTLRKLAKYRQRFLAHRATRQPPWVPTQKMPRPLTTSASAVRKLLLKAELMGVDPTALLVPGGPAAPVMDIRKKWHVPPAFSIEFIGYYLDRNVRLESMKKRLKELLDINSSLQDEYQMLRPKYDQLLKEKAELSRTNVNLKQTIHKYHSVILHVAPTKDLPSIDALGKSAVVLRPPSVCQGSEVSVERIDAGPLPLSECGICRRTSDQHLLAKCDTCHLFYHLGCLNPPLTRMPKKTKLMGWQCSECDKESSGSEVECVDTEAPRKLRHNKEGEGKAPEPRPPKVTIKPLGPEPPPIQEPIRTFAVSIPSGTQGIMTISSKLGPPPPSDGHSQRQSKKRRREKHHRYSPDSLGSPSKEHKRKRKRKSQDMEHPSMESTPRIKIKIKPIPMPEGEGSKFSGPQMFVATSSTETSSIVTPSPVQARSRTSSERLSSGPKRGKDADVMTHCDVCGGPGSNQNLVRCDECLKCFHFTCLDPPVKKSPKRRGYSWHCAECDPTETDSDN